MNIEKSLYRISPRTIFAKCFLLFVLRTNRKHFAESNGESVTVPSFKHFCIFELAILPHT